MGIVHNHGGEMTRFIIQGRDPLVRNHFGHGLHNESLDIFDPARGTETLIVELLESLYGDRAALA
jgi:predicted helicase